MIRWTGLAPWENSLFQVALHLTLRQATLSSLDDFEFSELPEQSTLLVAISDCGSLVTALG